MAKALTLTPGKTRLAELRRIYREELCAEIDLACRPRVEAAARIVAEAACGEAPVYGINTGFGKLASTRIPADQTSQLQRNLILSHCCGVGDPLPAAVVRLVITLKMLSLGRGASGVRWEIIERLQTLLRLEMIPLIPAQGSVGASGDLAPLAHLTAAMIGEGHVFYEGAKISASEALRMENLEPLELGPKEGLGMINGTQVSTALALAGLFDAWNLAQTALISGAMTTDALMGSTRPFRPEIHALRGLRGQIDAAQCLRTLLEGSEIRESHLENDERVQDPYSFRCQPQVMGACLDQFRQVAQMLEIEANAVTDNPIVVVEDGSILSGGNFHAEPVAFGADQCALAIAEIGSIAERRIATAVDPVQNFGLPAFISPDPGLNSGFMIAEVTAAALMAENKQRAMPCSIDSTPTSANQEDHVSMACHAARRLGEMNHNLAFIIAIELLIAVQGIEFRAPVKTSGRLALIMAAVRAQVAPLGDDRYLADDIAAIKQLVMERGIITSLGEPGLLPQLES
ncbi:MAG: histidine ammonia-lyase [Gammaproteobacteria bacterium]|nr:histidine ammonia-lyase [Gammaproteobacteria bacterium]MDH3446521.1 histidine ammonia-lyase [Gammaproteobacteria bacterium]